MGTFRSGVSRLAPAGAAFSSLLLACLILAAAVSPAAELPDVEVSDVLDYPVSLRSIPARDTTLFFICDPAVKECREGAVLFESRAPAMRRAGVRPVLLFEGKGADVREAVLGMNLELPVYIDGDGSAVGRMLDQGVMPALLLAAPDATIIETIYGGGESLAGNIQSLLTREAPEAEPPQPAPAPEEKKGVSTYAVLAGVGALLLIGLLLLAD